MDFNITSYSSTAGDAFTLFNLTGGASETYDFSSVDIGSTSLTDSSRTWSGTYLVGTYQFKNSTGQLTVVAAPEPSTFGLLGLGALALGIAARRRRL